MKILEIRIKNIYSTQIYLNQHITIMTEKNIIFQNIFNLKKLFKKLVLVLVTDILVTNA